MGFLDFFFKKPKKLANEKRQRSAKTPQGKDPYDDFSPAKWVFKEAFDTVMKGVVIDDSLKNCLSQKMWPAFRSGSPRETDKAAESILVDQNWEWPEFEKWKAEFQKSNAFPFMWEMYPEVYKSAPTGPSTMKEALKYFNVKEMRKILKDRDIKIRPAPRKRVEFEKAIEDRLTIGDLKNELTERLRNQKALHLEMRKQGLCKLISHTITASTYIRARKYQKDQYDDFLKKKYPLKLQTDNGCPVEDRIAKEKTKNGITSLPPFFPGDRTGLI